LGAIRFTHGLTTTAAAAATATRTSCKTTSSITSHDERRQSRNNFSPVLCPTRSSLVTRLHTKIQNTDGTSDSAAAAAAAAAALSSNSTKIEGIGGKGGVVYDVNRLKRNLLQETMSAYKDELFELLSRSTPADDEEILEKLLALVQASPVRTTTDSNLLDGDDDWVLAYRSQYPTTVSTLILYESDKLPGQSKADTPRFNARYNFLFHSADKASPDISNSNSNSNSNNPKSKKKQQRRNKAGGSGIVRNKMKEFCQTRQRSFRLEDLDEDEDAYILDTTSIFGGILTKSKMYAVEGLTRSSLTLRKESTRWSFLGGPTTPKHTQEYIDSQKKKGTNRNSSNISNNNNSNNKSVSVQIIYLDNDFCILTEEDGPDSPFMVYTRNKAYLDVKKSVQRRLKWLQMAVWGLVSLPLRNLKNNNAFGRSSWQTSAISTASTVTGRGSAAKLRVLRLGDVRGEEEDFSWESESDPFVHLSADERQRLLKAMSVSEVEQAADTYRNARMRFRFIRKLFGRKKTYFKKPPAKWRKPK